jgi:hypothetical protein
MIEHHIKVQRTARYYMSCELTEATKEVWIVLHGFAHLAESFLQKFEFAFSDTRVFVSPEALNRFYVQGRYGKVGATWMTKEDRLNEIADYINYLNELYAGVPSSNS